MGMQIFSIRSVLALVCMLPLLENGDGAVVNSEREREAWPSTPSVTGRSTRAPSRPGDFTNRLKDVMKKIRRIECSENAELKTQKKLCMDMMPDDQKMNRDKLCRTINPNQTMDETLHILSCNRTAPAQELRKKAQEYRATQSKIHKERMEEMKSYLKTLNQTERRNKIQQFRTIFAKKREQLLKFADCITSLKEV